MEELEIMRYYSIIKQIDNPDIAFGTISLTDTNLSYIHSESNIDKTSWDANAISLTFDKTEKQKLMPDVLSNTVAIDILSKKFTNLLGNITGVKTLDIKQNNTGEYDLIHVTHAPIAALELSKSKGASTREMSNGDIIESFTIPCVNTEVIDGLDFFRLPQRTVGYYVSEKVKNIYESNNLVGANFMEIRTI